MKENSKIKTMLEKYMIQEMNQNELLDETKKVLYENLKDNRYRIDFIKEYFLITEILDLKDCNKQECDKFVQRYIDVYYGKESLKSIISVQLCKEHLSEEVLEALCVLNKLIFESNISVQEENIIKCFMEENNTNSSTLYDLVIDQLKDILRWGFRFDDMISYEPKSMLYICDEVDLKNKLFERINSIIAVLLGNKPIWITCIYENGNCSLRIDI